MKHGRIIKLLRTAEGLSQISLAAKLDVSRTYLSQVENNRKQPSLLFLKEISKTFNVPLALLLIDENDSDSAIFMELNRILSDLLTTKLRLAKG